MGDFTIKTDKIEKILKENNFQYAELKKATPTEFFNAIGTAKKNNKFGAFVTQRSIEEYENMSFLFLTLDNNAGIAITSDNNIVSVFNGGEKKGVLKTLIPVALKCGGNKLDNYDSDKLSSLYELYGFNPISQVEFDQKFAPDDWNYSRDGEPNIVFWIHNGDSAEDVILNFGGYDVDWDNVKTFKTYEQAEQYRDNKLREQPNKKQDE